jgi:hypothetical protein
MADSQDANGSPSDGMHYSGTGSFEVVNGTGPNALVPFTIHYTVTADRIRA